MTAAIRFYRDRNHCPRVQASRDYNVLADYLESDLQEPSTIAEVLRLVEQSRNDVGQEITGNSYTLLVRPDQISLENQFDDEAPPFHLPTSRAIPLLSAWAAFLDNDGLMSIVPVF